MRKACSIRKILLTVFVLTASLCGCRQASVNEIMLGDWINEIIGKAGIFLSDETVPYYLNIPEDSVWFKTAQTAVDWQIIDPEEPFDPAQPLTREWAAYTLINLSGISLSQADHTIRDLSAGRFPVQISTAVSSGLMYTDSHNRFRPAETMDRQEAEELLTQVVSYINTRSFESQKSEIGLNDEYTYIEEEPLSYDSASSSVLFPAGQTIRTGDVVRTGNEEHPYGMVEYTEETEEGITAYITETEPEELIGQIDIQGSFDADFSDAVITDLLDGSSIQQESSYTEPANFRLMAVRPYSRTHEINGFSVSYTVSSAGVKAYISKQSANGLSVSAEASLSGVRPVFQWKGTKGNVEYGYFRIDCSTNESFSARRSAWAEGYANAKDISADHFLESLKNAFSPQRDTAVLNVPLCTIRIPVPEIPLLYVICTIALKIDAQGKAELNLSQQHSVGMEIRDGKMRAIHDTENTSRAALYGSTSFLSSVSFGLSTAEISLTDAQIEAGISADITSTVHRYDKDGSHSVSDTALPADLVAQQADGVSGILVCSDVNAVWILNMILNSANTLAGRYGFAKSMSLLTGGAANVFPAGSTHMENFHFVDHCTRTDRDVKPDYRQLPASEQIEIASYTLIGNPGDTAAIVITALPEDCQVSDLRFSSDDSTVAEADAGGRVIMKQSGNTIVTVSSSDGSYRVMCSIHVRNVEDHADQAD